MKWVLGWIVVSVVLVVAWRCCIGPKSPEEQELEDREQREYLDKRRRR